MAWPAKHKVLVPFDFSDGSVAAAETALELVAAPSGLHILHVLPVLPVGEPGFIWEETDDEYRREHATEALRKQFAEAKFADCHLEVVFGDPGQEIADYADRTGAELIVMPSHGRRGLSRLLLGSVAERVLRLATCPVLILKHPAGAK